MGANAAQLERDGAERTGVGAKASFLKRAEAITAAEPDTAARRACHKHLRKSVFAFRKADYGRAAHKAVDATEADPTCSQAYHMLALSLENLGEVHKALGMYEKALALDPTDTDLYLNLGLAAWRMKMRDVAEKLFRIYCEMEPDQPMGWNNLAGVLRDDSRFDDAIELCRSAIYRMPEQPLLWNTLGTILVEQSEFDQAGLFYREALRLDPGFARAWHNLGYGLHHTGPLDEALACYDRALALTTEPHDRIETTHARALCYLSMGNVAEGFPAYEIRHNHAHRASVLYGIDAPIWRGEPLEGKTVLAIGEQGLGDEVMFANVLPDLLAEVGETGKLKVAADARLLPLLQRSLPGAQLGNYVVTRHNTKELRLVGWAGKPDYVVPFGTALAHRRLSLDAFPGKAFFTPAPARVETYRAQLAERPGLKVGICWRSMMINAQRQKYFGAIDLWGDIFATPGVTFVNLQYGDAAPEMERARHLFGTDIVAIEGLDLKNDLDGAAALSAACDLVISAPTAAAALAGAVGTEVWFLVAGPVWPQLGTDHYPWYRASHVYAPQTFGDWPDVMPRVAAALAARAAA
ncbi:MAG: tetratricopeptide repeat protein [Alphaproteobacteria bacterium]|nr:tetratricopeptide repeat protein [Alphaproteobacteria bacterium]